MRDETNAQAPRPSGGQSQRWPQATERSEACRLRCPPDGRRWESVVASPPPCPCPVSGLPPAVSGLRRRRRSTAQTPGDGPGQPRTRASNPPARCPVSRQRFPVSGEGADRAPRPQAKAPGRPEHDQATRPPGIRSPAASFRSPEKAQIERSNPGDGPAQSGTRPSNPPGFRYRLAASGRRKRLRSNAQFSPAAPAAPECRRNAHSSRIRGMRNPSPP